MKETTRLHNPIAQTRKQRWKRWATKKWLFPAIYMTAAAAILSVMWIYDLQQAKPTVQPNSESESDQVPIWNAQEQSQSMVSPAQTNSENVNLTVSTEAEALQWPVTDVDNMVVGLPYYQEKSAEPAMVTYEDTIRPHVGVDFVRADQQSFEIMAALSGKVNKVLIDPLVGGVIELTHDGGLSTLYQSVTEIKVKAGQSVKQGEIIAKAGRSELEKKQGTHLHFEVRKDGEPIDPEKVIKKNQ